MKRYAKALVRQIEDATGSTLLSDIVNTLRGHHIFVAGMECTGSTFVHQVVMAMGKSPCKVHHYVSGSAPKLVTYRDPRDILCSYARRQMLTLTESKGIEAGLLASHRELFAEHRRYEDLCRYRDDKHALLIRYEDYFGKREQELVELLAETLEIYLEEPAIQQILSEFSLESNLKRAQQHKSFSEYDRASLVHGNHISNAGRSGAWKLVFTPRVCEIVKKDLGDILIEFGYERDLNW